MKHLHEILIKKIEELRGEQAIIDQLITRIEEDETCVDRYYAYELKKLLIQRYSEVDGRRIGLIKRIDAI